MKTKPHKINNGYSDTETLMCPYCDEEIEDAGGDFGNNDVEEKYKCPHCEKDFMVEAHADGDEEPFIFSSSMMPCSLGKHAFEKKYTWDAWDHERGWLKGLKKNYYICPNCSETKTVPLKVDGTEYTEKEIAFETKKQEKLEKRDNNKDEYPSPTKAKKEGYWGINDSSIYIWTKEPWGNRRLFLNIITILKKHGFNVTHDQDVEKNYKSLSRSHRYGVWKTLEFNAEYHPARIEFEFFQNVVAFDGRKIGEGKYGFNKLKNMPYLLRIRCQLALKIITDYLNSLDIKEKIVNKIDCHGQPELDAYKTKEEKVNAIKTTNDKVAEYNNKDKNKKELKNGDLKYYYAGPDYRLSCGYAYHNINNMWWVVSGKTTYRNLGSFELFDFDPSLPRRKSKDRAIDKLTRKLNGLIEKRDFEACIKVRDSIKILESRKKKDAED